jgi:hypothetical protein
MLAIRCGFSNWMLRYDAAIVFDIYIQVCTRNHLVSEPQDFRKAVRSKPMIGVIAEVRLQHDLLLFSGLSATIDEVPDHMPNFSDVCMWRDVITIRENKPGKCCRISFERAF